MSARIEAQTRWRALAARLGLTPEAADAGWAELRAAYGEPHRAYHDMAHIQAVLSRGEDWAARLRDPDAFALAAWFHDVVYRGAPGRDERDSAARLRAFAAANGLAGPSIDRAEAMILATITHQPPAPEDDAASFDAALYDDTALFLDADLEILAAPPDVYAAYARAIRREYAHAPEPAFRAGRRAALTALLARDPLYRAAEQAADWMAAARRNMTHELTQLDRGNLAEG